MTVNDIARRGFVWGLVGLVCLMACSIVAAETKPQDLHLEVKLIWGTNDGESPDPTHKRLDSGLTKWLAKTYQWKNYFEVNLQQADLPLNTPKKLVMSKDCTLTIKNLGGSRLEVEVMGRGKPVIKGTHTLPEKDRLVIAGDAKNDTAWFIAFKSLPQSK